MFRVTKSHLACCLLLVVNNAYAATQGTLGATSTGTATISVTKSVQAQISDLQDMTLANWGVGDGAVSLSSNVCVYSSTGNYKVTASGSGAASAFTLSNGSTNIAYSVTWNAGGAGNLSNTGTALTTSVQSTGYTTATTASANCSGGGASNDTARVIVGITSGNMDAAVSSATAYTGTLTLLVSPY
ncbi:MAG: hypothetical protein V4629_01440 [Pseudomonadota bacterium]